jgi:predicted nucleic acid-binding protein
MTNAKLECFLDTNILIYAATGKQSDPTKFGIAYRLVLDANFGVSGQTLAEFCSVVRRKNLLSLEDLGDWLRYLGELPLLAVDEIYVLAGLAMAERYNLSYFDAALLAAAERLGAPVFYTEGLNHNQFYGSVRAVNPFLEP